MTNKENKLFASAEIMGALLTEKLSSADVASFASDPSSFIYSSLSADVGDISLSVVENDIGVIHLALPYYSEIESHSANILTDGDVDDVSGGELLISLLIGTIACAATGVAVTSVAVAAAGGAYASQGKDIDGEPK